MTPIVKMFHRSRRRREKKCPHFTTEPPHGAWPMVVNYGEITRVHLTREILFLFSFAGAFSPHTLYGSGGLVLAPSLVY